MEIIYEQNGLFVRAEEFITVSQIGSSSFGINNPQGRILVGYNKKYLNQKNAKINLRVEADQSSYSPMPTVVISRDIDANHLHVKGVELVAHKVKIARCNLSKLVCDNIRQGILVRSEVVCNHVVKGYLNHQSLLVCDSIDALSNDGTSRCICKKPKR